MLLICTYSDTSSFSAAGTRFWNSLWYFGVTASWCHLLRYTLKSCLSAAVAHCDCCFCEPRINTLTYLLTYLLNSSPSKVLPPLSECYECHCIHQEVWRSEPTVLTKRLRVLLKLAERNEQSVASVLPSVKVPYSLRLR